MKGNGLLIYITWPIFIKSHTIGNKYVYIANLYLSKSFSTKGFEFLIFVTIICN